MATRLLRNSILSPSVDVATIENRLDTVGELVRRGLWFVTFSLIPGQSRTDRERRALSCYPQSSCSFSVDGLR